MSLSSSLAAWLILTLIMKLPGELIHLAQQENIIFGRALLIKPFEPIEEVKCRFQVFVIHIEPHKRKPLGAWQTPDGSLPGKSGNGHPALRPVSYANDLNRPSLEPR
jgi:hypothetical protein